MILLIQILARKLTDMANIGTLTNLKLKKESNIESKMMISSWKKLLENKVLSLGNLGEKLLTDAN